MLCIFQVNCNLIVELNVFSVLKF